MSFIVRTMLVGYSTRESHYIGYTDLGCGVDSRFLHFTEFISFNYAHLSN